MVRIQPAIVQPCERRDLVSLVLAMGADAPVWVGVRMLATSRKSQSQGVHSHGGSARCERPAVTLPADFATQQAPKIGRCVEEVHAKKRAARPWTAVAAFGRERPWTSSE